MGEASGRSVKLWSVVANGVACGGIGRTCGVEEAWGRAESGRRREKEALLRVGGEKIRL